MTGTRGKYARFIVFIFLSVLWALPIFAGAFPCALGLQELVQFEKRREGFLREEMKHSSALRERIRVVALVVVVRDGKLLLGQRKNGVEEGTYGVVGGKMDEIDLTLVAAVIREFQEETGLLIEPERLEFLRAIPPHVADDGYYYAPYVYRLELDEEEEPKVMEPDKIEGDWEWYEPSQLPEPLFSTNKRLLRDSTFLEALGLSPA